MACCPVLFNPRKKYTVATAPASVRKRWAKQAAETRRRCALALRRKMARGYDPEARHIVPASSVPVVRASAPLPSIYEEEDAVVGTNPELMVIHNPCHYRRRASNARFTISHRRNTMRRRRRRNSARKGSYRSLVRQMGVKKAARLWRKSKRGRRKARNSWHGQKKRHARAARKGWRGRRRGRKGARRRSRKSSKYCRRRVRKGSYRALVRKLGVKKAVKIWRKRKRKCKR